MPKETKMFFKIVFLGHTNSGKTSIIRQYISSKFDDTLEKTIGASYSRGELNVQGHPVQLYIV